MNADLGTIEHRTDTAPKGSILLAEDSPTAKLLATAMLKEAGFEVTSVENGRQALAAARARRFDLVLMDIHMPEMDGLEAATEIRSLPDDRGRVPIIAITAYAAEIDRAACISAGMNDYTSKPINREVLLATIGGWMQQSAENTDPPARRGESAAGVLNALALERLERDFSPDILRELVKSFVVETTAHLRQLRAAAEAEDTLTLGREALALKAGAGSLGATKLFDHAEQIELASLAANMPEAQRLVQALPRTSYDACKAMVERYLQTH